MKKRSGRVVRGRGQVVRGTTSEWLERLCYGAESHRKVEFKAGLHHGTTGKLCQLSSKWVPFWN